RIETWVPPQTSRTAPEIARGGRGEEEGRLGDVVGGELLPERGLACGAGHVARLVLDGAGRDGVDGDAGAAQLERERLRHADEAELRGAVGDDVRLADSSVDRGDVHDAAVRRARQRGERGADQEIRRLQVRVED